MLANKNYILFFLIILFFGTVAQQTYTPLKQGNKWGYQKNGIDIIPAKYDTILPFDSVKKICMACVKSMKPNNSKIIKMNTMTMLCKYLNDQNQELVVKIKNDTCSYFNLNKSSYAGYSNHKNYLIVSARDKKYIVDKNFKQITFIPYDDIVISSIRDHFVVLNKTVGASYLEGVIDVSEKMVIPMEYTSISSNPFDTLFSACTAQLKLNGMDDVYDHKGTKLHSFNRHVENATKNFIIHQIHEPNEYYIIYNLANKKEKIIHAEDITYLGNDMVNIRIKGKYHKCNLFELDTYKFLEHE